MNFDATFLTIAGVIISVIFTFVLAIGKINEEAKDLEKKITDVIETKQNTMDKEFIKIIRELAIKWSKKKKKVLSEEQRANIFYVSYITSKIGVFSEKISKIRDKLSKSYFYGIISGLGIVGLAIYLGFNPSFIVTNSGSTVIIIIIIGYLVYMHVDCGIYQFIKIRELDKKIVELKKAEGIDEIRDIVREEE